MMEVATIAGLFVITAAQAGVVISDTFNITENRATDSTLTGSTTEAGSKTWSANAAVLLAQSDGNGYATRIANNVNSEVGYVKFNLNDYSSMGTLVTASLDIGWTGNMGSWIGVGLGRNNGLSSNSNVYAIITQTGWQLTARQSSGNVIIASGNFETSLSGSNWNKISLSYDTATDLASLSVNGVVVADSITANSVKWTINTVVIHQQYITNFQMDNFSLSVDASPVPEPASLGALALPLLGLLVCRKK